MRQAGRYLPEYQQIRKSSPNFLDLCFNPHLASEITLQPIKRFNFDAAIIFSDILLIPKALGVEVNFYEKIGPILSGRTIDYDEKNFINKLSPVYEAIDITRDQLDKKKPLIGFTGGPFTLLCYILAKGKVQSKENFLIKNLLDNYRENLKILEILEESVFIHLSNQINAGANIVKIFESWAGIATQNELFHTFIINPTKRIINRIRKKHSGIPIMTFPRNAGIRYKIFTENVKPDIITIDYSLDLDWVRENLSNKVILQGNLNPTILLGNKSEIASNVLKIVNKLGKGNFIFNLGHGILPTTPISNVEYLLEVLKNV